MNYMARMISLSVKAHWEAKLSSEKLFSKVKEGYVGQRQKHLGNKAMRELLLLKKLQSLKHCW